ncbi:MAG TPA: class I SAM-dependent methyltransferase [Streptosporangiaceae bacterium]
MAGKVDADRMLRETICSYNAHPDFYVRRYCHAGLERYRRIFMAALPDASARILDGGCGPGRDCLAFHQSGLTVVGLDLAFNLLLTARKIAPVPLINADLRVLPFRNESFEGVWLCASLVHLLPPSVNAALREASRVLGCGGILFASVRKGAPGWRQDGLGGRRWFAGFDEEGFISALRDSGLELFSEHGGSASSDGWINVLARKP